MKQTGCLFVLLLAPILALSGCSVTAIRKHEPNFKNVRELEKAKGSFFVKEVKAGQAPMEDRLKTSSLTCRLTTFNMPAGDTVSSFVKNALTDELDAAQKLNPKGTAIVLEVNALDSSSGMDKGSWTLDFNYVVGGKATPIKTITEFESAYAADTACRNTANALTDALKENFSAFYKKLPR